MIYFNPGVSAVALNMNVPNQLKDRDCQIYCQGKNTRKFDITIH